MSDSGFELKGSMFTLSTIMLHSADLSLLERNLQQKVAQAPNLFQHAPIAIQLDKVTEQTVDIAALAKVVQQTGMILVGVSGGSSEQKQQAKQLGIPVLSSPVAANQKANDSKTAEPAAEPTATHSHKPALTVNGAVRSGQQIYAKDTDLIIVGSVGNGAEVIADGNIHIYGTLRGRAIAGAKGDNSAKIFCQKLEAELVSIDGTYKLSEALQGELWGKAAKISRGQDSIQISELNN